MNTERTALICIDFVNEICHEEGKLAGKGYTDFITKNNTFAKTQELQKWARENVHSVMHSRVCFNHDHHSYMFRAAENSPLFGKAKEFNVLAEASWGTEFIEQVKPLETESIWHKQTVSAFPATRLKGELKERDINTLIIAGVATDLAVLATAFAAHDMGFNVIVAADACAAASGSEHQNALAILRKIAQVKTVDEIIES